MGFELIPHTEKFETFKGFDWLSMNVAGTVHLIGCGYMTSHISFYQREIKGFQKSQVKISIYLVLVLHTRINYNIL